MIGLWGANGFIGRHLASALRQRGQPAILFARGFEGFPLAFGPGLQPVTADFTDFNCCAADLRRCDVLVLMVSASGVQTFADRPDLEEEHNIAPYRRFLAALEASRIRPRQIIFLSSGGAVYGVTGPSPVDETHPTLPVSAYGQGKLTIEALISSHAKKTGAKATILRVANPVGRWSKKPNLLTLALQAARTGVPMEIRGDGSMVRDYFAVEELAACIANIIETPPPAMLYNVGSGIGHSIDQVLALAAKIGGRPVPVRHGQGSPFDVPYNVLDCTRIFTDTGWKAGRRLEDIIKGLHF